MFQTLSTFARRYPISTSAPTHPSAVGNISLVQVIQTHHVYVCPEGFSDIRGDDDFNYDVKGGDSSKELEPHLS